jgi:hypothetical protein
LAKHTLVETVTCKENNKTIKNGESLNQAHCSCCEKKITNIQCYIYMGQRPNLNPKLNSKFNPKPFSTMY